jgi:hypothetical protein
MLLFFSDDFTNGAALASPSGTAAVLGQPRRFHRRRHLTRRLPSGASVFAGGAGVSGDPARSLVLPESWASGWGYRDFHNWGLAATAANDADRGTLADTVDTLLSVTFTVPPGFPLINDSASMYSGCAAVFFPPGFDGFSNVAPLASLAPGESATFSVMFPAGMDLLFESPALPAVIVYGYSDVDPWDQLNPITMTWTTTAPGRAPSTGRARLGYMSLERA